MRNSLKCKQFKTQLLLKIEICNKNYDLFYVGNKKIFIIS